MSAAEKAALRTQISSKLASLTAQQIVAQSAAIFSHLSTIPQYTACRSASIYLPMDGGKEVDTWPIVADLISKGASVAIPQVAGKAATDMRMLRLSSLDQAKAFPRTKWGIPEPDAATAESMEVATESPELSLLLVPGVAFDARCGRLGHGRGYYDAFISRQRALTRPDGTPRLAVIGLALREQMLDSTAVPMGETDERLDLIITPDGPLAYTSEEDTAKAAKMMKSSGEQAASAAAAVDVSDGAAEKEEEASSSLPALSLRCEIATGKYKYACLRVSPRFGRTSGKEFIAVRSGPGAYHADVAEPSMDTFEAMGYSVEPLGGGRIVRKDAPVNTVEIYGYSVGFGGGEGGPPGRGMDDHSQTAALVRELLPSHSVTFSPHGY